MRLIFYLVGLGEDRQNYFRRAVYCMVEHKSLNRYIPLSVFSPKERKYWSTIFKYHTTAPNLSPKTKLTPAKICIQIYNYPDVKLLFYTSCFHSSLNTITEDEAEEIVGRVGPRILDSTRVVDDPVKRHLRKETAERRERAQTPPPKKEPLIPAMPSFG